jgi:hypothetical protein
MQNADTAEARGPLRAAEMQPLGDRVIGSGLSILLNTKSAG